MTRQRQPGQLPSGRHGLTRSYVRRNQRDRMAKAMIDVMQERGIEGISVNDIIGPAGLSRRTFYGEFDSLQALIEYAWDQLSSSPEAIFDDEEMNALARASILAARQQSEERYESSMPLFRGAPFRAVQLILDAIHELGYRIVRSSDE